MRFTNIFKKIKENHWLMMLICCAVPLIILVVAVYIFGLSNKYLFWFILLLCPILHYFMMKDMYKKHSTKEGNKKAKNTKINKEV